jgi:hypothetical protein
LAWHFCNKNNTSKLEKIQERALQFIYDDFVSSYDELLVKAKIPSLKIRRMRISRLYKNIHLGQEVGNYNKICWRFVFCMNSEILIL